MRFYVFLAVFIAAVVVTTCKPTFFGTNVRRQEVYHRDMKFSSWMFRKRVEFFNFTMPAWYYGRSIQGILAYDVTNSEASANVTSGGLGYNYVTLRMKSGRGDKLHYDIYIYA